MTKWVFTLDREAMEAGLLNKEGAFFLLGGIVLVRSLPGGGHSLFGNHLRRAREANLGSACLLTRWRINS